MLQREPAVAVKVKGRENQRPRCHDERQNSGEGVNVKGTHEVKNTQKQNKDKSPRRKLEIEMDQ